jgi:cephalosporin hydroxylase
MLPKNANSPDLIAAMAADPELAALKRQLHARLTAYRYTYNFTWFSRPIIQLPEDIVALQEVILSTRPRLIVETGIAHGGSLMLSASMLELLGGDGLVTGIDIDIREHNRIEIEKHPLFKRIRLIHGSSVDDGVAAEVRELARSRDPVLVILDSNHTHAHVLRELQLYSPLVRAGSYVVVMDTSIDDLPTDYVHDRPWGAGNNPKTAVQEFLRGTDRFMVDKEIEHKLLQTVCPDGYLRCVRD